MTRKKMFIFDAYDTENNLVVSGCAPELADKLGCSRGTICVYAQSERLLYGKYRIKKVGEGYVSYENHKRKEETKDLPEWVFRMLREYGNTVMPKNISVENCLAILKENGLDCIAKKRPNIVEGRTRGYWYLLEVKGKPVPYKSNWEKYEPYKRACT